MINMGIDSLGKTDGRGIARRIWGLAREALRRGGEWAGDRRFAAEHARLLEEFERTGELETLMEVTGATRDQLQAAELSPLASLDLLHGMMQRLGIDISHAQHDALQQAQWHCRMCEEWRECRRWLDAGAADQRYRDFCGNAGLLDRLGERLAAEVSSRRPK